ncbi:hypothetical protein BU26DRAFT_522257 [Trematosphaeria pertusa]|uniref:Uncharacterized protein n=1 Tax=Trematosphaeria pertusa TaxID=390896 RepID=A0A6A6I460_9PLEO|nr:uncharacterized protein BU26DRAFT_522257 [Trematosphaeria pertusa]KAF2245141.1 hypothetical protein BU26DRAFT_522257 [Trematosphaeria pertusa]
MADAQTEGNAKNRIRTDTDLTDLLTTQHARFGDGAFDLGTAEIEQLRNFTELAATIPNTIKRAWVRKNACIILRDLAKKNRAAFFLCALGTLPYLLGRLKSTTYMEAVGKWWREAVQWPGLFETMDNYSQYLPRPKGLAQAMKHYAARLPGTPAPPDRPESLDQETEHHADLPPGAKPQGGWSLTIPLHNLLDFLKDKYTDTPVQIHCPFDVRSPPSVQFGPAEWDMRMEFGLGIAKAVMEHGMQSEATYIQPMEQSQ